MRTYRLVVRPRFGATLARSGLRAAADFLDPPAGESVVRARTSTTRRIELRDGSFYLKIYEYGSWGDIRRGLLRNTFLGRSRPHSEWRSLVFQLRHRVGAVEPVAWGEARTLRFLRKAFLLTREAVGHEPVDRLLAEGGLRLPSERRAFVRDLARHTARMHRTRFADGDYHLRNLLARRLRDGWKFRNLDSPKGRVFSWGPLRARAQRRDLALLDRDARGLFRATERLRFLLQYLGVPRLDERGRRAVRRILRAERSLGSRLPPRPTVSQRDVTRM